MKEEHNKEPSEEELDKERRERLELKRMSQAAQQRFRQKLMERTSGVGDRLASMQQQQQQRRNEPSATTARRHLPSWTWTDFLIGVLVLSIAIIVGRRVGHFFLGSGSSGENEISAETGQL